MMPYRELDTSEIQTLLVNARTIAIIGVSDKPDRPSYSVAKYLLTNSHYGVYLVNPLLKELFGEPVYPSLKEIPVPVGSIDIVDVFRKLADIQEVFEEARAIRAQSIWLQLGLSHPEVATAATVAGMRIVMDRCTKIDYEALVRN